MYTCHICVDQCFHDASAALRHLCLEHQDEPKEIQITAIWWFEFQFDLDRAQERDPRISFYKWDVLLKGGIRPEPGHSVGAKWIEFVTKRTRRTSIKEVTKADWKYVLDDLDVRHRRVGDIGVVQFVEAVRGGTDDLPF